MNTLIILIKPIYKFQDVAFNAAQTRTKSVCGPNKSKYERFFKVN